MTEKEADWRARYERYLHPRHRCVASYCGNPARYLNMACEVHFELLSERAQQALRSYVAQRHPRGGGVTTIPEGLMAAAYADDGIVRREWRAQLTQDVDDGMYDDQPEVIAAVRRTQSEPPK